MFQVVSWLLVHHNPERTMERTKEALWEGKKGWWREVEEGGDDGGKGFPRYEEREKLVGSNSEISS